MNKNYSNKKILSPVLFFGLLILVLPKISQAYTSISFSPSNVDVTAGKTFSVAIKVNPNLVKNSTVKITLNYPTDLLSVKSFSQPNAWIPISASTYNNIDNIAGVLIKTGGYPGGISDETLFGTVVFSAKKSGKGYIKVDVSGKNSLALDSNGKNILDTNSNYVLSFNINKIITAPVKVVSETVMATSSDLVASSTDIVNSASTTDEEVSPVVLEPATSTTLGVSAAAVVSSPEFFGKKDIIYLSIITLLLVGLIISMRRRRI